MHNIYVSIPISRFSPLSLPALMSIHLFLHLFLYFCFPNERTRQRRCGVYTVVYYSALKRNRILSFVETWMELENVIQSEVSQKQTEILYINTFMWPLEKWYWWSYHSRSLCLTPVSFLLFSALSSILCPMSLILQVSAELLLWGVFLKGPSTTPHGCFPWGEPVSACVPPHRQARWPCSLWNCLSSLQLVRAGVALSVHLQDLPEISIEWMLYLHAVVLPAVFVWTADTCLINTGWNSGADSGKRASQVVQW